MDGNGMGWVGSIDGMGWDEWMAGMEWDGWMKMDGWTDGIHGMQWIGWDGMGWDTTTIILYFKLATIIAATLTKANNIKKNKQQY